MRRPCPSSLALATALVAVVPSAPTLGIAATVVPVGAFRSVTLRNGGTVTMRHASKARVTLVEGSEKYSKITVESGGRLVIDRCPGDCPEDYAFAVEVLAPAIDEVRVIDGGTLQSAGGFPHREGVRAEVEEGGTIDLRSMSFGAGEEAPAQLVAGNE